MMYLSFMTVIVKATAKSKKGWLRPELLVSTRGTPATEKPTHRKANKGTVARTRNNLLYCLRHRQSSPSCAYRTIRLTNLRCCGEALTIVRSRDMFLNCNLELVDNIGEDGWKRPCEFLPDDIDMIWVVGRLAAKSIFRLDRLLKCGYVNRSSLLSRPHTYLLDSCIERHLAIWTPSNIVNHLRSGHNDQP